jgi:hypothetical protein
VLTKRKVVGERLHGGGSGGRMGRQGREAGELGAGGWGAGQILDSAASRLSSSFFQFGVSPDIHRSVQLLPQQRLEQIRFHFFDVPTAHLSQASLRLPLSMPGCI